MLTAKQAESRRESQRKWREANKDKIREYYREWYAKNGRTRSPFHREYILQWNQNNPGKRRAHALVARAIKQGTLIRADHCEVCNIPTTYLDGHHDDYRKPLKVRWVCQSCHRKIHAARKSR